MFRFPEKKMNGKKSFKNMIYLISWISVPFWKYENRKSIQINHVEWKFFKMRAVSIFTSFFQF